mmetsp:Transcript_14067/g.35825  ORF Transcript_14067/g.35825 Transcript_14067/m.35825 type:complete len:115 (-) Transcript_14067:476-820(-)
MGAAFDRMHARTATLVGGGSGFSALQRDTMGMRGDGTAAPFAVQPTQPPQPRAQSDELLRFNESMRVLEQAASLQQQQQQQLRQLVGKAAQSRPHAQARAKAEQGQERETRALA